MLVSCINTDITLQDLSRSSLQLDCFYLYLQHHLLLNYDYRTSCHSLFTANTQSSICYQGYRQPTSVKFPRAKQNLWAIDKLKNYSSSLKEILSIEQDTTVYQEELQFLGVKLSFLCDLQNHEFSNQQIPCLIPSQLIRHCISVESVSSSVCNLMVIHQQNLLQTLVLPFFSDNDQKVSNQPCFVYSPNSHQHLLLD